MWLPQGVDIAKPDNAPRMLSPGFLRTPRLTACGGVGGQCMSGVVKVV